MPPIRIRTSLAEGIFTLKTLDDFLMPGFELEDHGYYSDTGKRKELIHFFLGSARLSRMASTLMDMLEAADRGEVREDEIRAGMKKFGEIFERIGNGAFLGAGGYRAYLPGADAAAAQVPEEHRTAVWAHVMLYCMMCATVFEDFPTHVQCALLKGFLPAQESADKLLSLHAQNMERCIENGVTEFTFGWQKLPDVPVTACRLVNPLEKGASFNLLTPLGRRTVTVPAGGQMTALFAGNTMTCLKGNIRQRGDTAMCRSTNGGLQSLDIRSGRQREIEIQGDAPEDFAIGEYGKLFALRKSTLYLPDSRQIDGAMCVFAAGDSWIAVMDDGSTQSNKLEYCEEDVLAVVEDDGALHVICREDRDAQKEQMRVMLQRFETGDAQVAEQLHLNNGRLRLTVDNRLLWEGKR